MKLNHSPGPWVTRDPFLKVEGPSEMGGEFCVCDIRGWGYLTGKGHGALGLSEKEALAIQKANAELIASAPDMEKEIAQLRATVALQSDAFIASQAERARLTAELENRTEERDVCEEVMEEVCDVLGVVDDMDDAPGTARRLAADLTAAIETIKGMREVLTEVAEVEMFDAMMSGPVHKGFNYSALKRVMPKVRAALAQDNKTGQAL